MAGSYPDLVSLTWELIEIDSESKDERAIADYVEAKFRYQDFFDCTRVGNNVVLTPKDFDFKTGIVIAGHLDTVPRSKGMVNRRDVDTLVGLGAVDMKGGIGVMLALAMSRVLGKNVKFVFYACEEISREFSGLLELERSDPTLLQASGAILMEPTGGAIEVGCQGTARFKVQIAGRRAHSARPWIGSNAIHNASKFLSYISDIAVNKIIVEGCEYNESLSAVFISGGIAGNVIPDLVEIIVNFRFAPGRDDHEVLRDTSRRLEICLDLQRGDRVELIEWAPSAPPNLSNQMIANLGLKSNRAVRSKLGWTDVAFFWERNIAACNFGPGDPNLAHTSDEIVTRNELDEVWSVITAALT